MKFESDLVIFDLECNQPSGKIIEIGAVYINRDLCTLGTHFRTFVNPGEPISDYIRKLCNLSNENVTYIENKAPTLAEANTEFYKWATQKTKNVVLASWGNFDVTELHLQDKSCQFRRKAVDIKSIAAWELARRGIKSQNSLAAVCKALNVDIDEPRHRALPDAITTADLLCTLAKDCNDFKDQLGALTKRLAS